MNDEMRQKAEARGFYPTGKVGTNIATGLKAWELEHCEVAGCRLWILENGQFVAE